MLRYEILMLTVPEITEGEAGTIEKNLDQLVKDKKGEIISFEKWGRCRLAYPVRHNKYGIYYLARLELQETTQKLFEEIRSLFMVRYNDVIMRTVTCKLDPEKGLEYRRPEAVDEIPSRDVDSFLRKNKMEGLIKDKPSIAKETKPVSDSATVMPKLESLDSVEAKTGAEKVPAVDTTTSATEDVKEPSNDQGE